MFAVHVGSWWGSDWCLVDTQSFLWWQHDSMKLGVMHIRVMSRQWQAMGRVLHCYLPLVAFSYRQHVSYQASWLWLLGHTHLRHLTSNALSQRSFVWNTDLTVQHWCCRFVIIPDMLKNAPMFKRIDPKMKVGLGCSASSIRHRPAVLQQMCANHSSQYYLHADEECAHGSRRQR